jgi:hypothetical protein
MEPVCLEGSLPSKLIYVKAGLVYVKAGLIYVKAGLIYVKAAGVIRGAVALSR